MDSTFRLMLVEDNEGDIVMTRRALRNGPSSCDLSVVYDGLEAIKFLDERKAERRDELPQLILVDLNMPRMDGKTFLGQLKADERLRHIPIVVLTSSQSRSDICDCYQLGANCYAFKPFDVKEFTSTIRQMVHYWSSVVNRTCELVNTGLGMKTLSVV